MSDYSLQQNSGQSSKGNAYSPSVVVPPKSRLPLRKRLTVAPKKQPLVIKEEEDNYPPTPGSHSSSGSSESTIPLVQSPPKVDTIIETKKQPLKKSYTWISTRGKTTVLVNKTTNIKTMNNVGLPGNPLLWNNGDKYEPEDTIDSFKSAWLKDEEDISITEDEDEIKVQPITTPKKATSTKRGRPPISKSSSLEAPRRSSKQYNQDGKLYCVCRQHYDATRFMIACDRCDDWFHGGCIGINEKESEFIDLYFCNKCSKITGKKTSWKPKCSNPACFKAARIGINLGYLSKYCTDFCGMQVARARLELVEIKRRNNSDQSIRDNEPIARLALRRQKESRIHSFADRDDRKRLIKIRQVKREIRDILQQLYKRNELFQKATIDNNSANVCRFDPKLINDYKGDVCMKVDCIQHEQWQKNMSLQLEQEKKEQYKLLLLLEKERKHIKLRLSKRRSEKDVLEDEFLINTTVEAS